MKDLREIIYLIEQAEHHECEDITPLEEGETAISISDRLGDLVFKMRAHSEPLLEGVQNTYCLGVEAGLEMAAEMLENLIRELDEQQ